jgi:hypothetical protein
MDMQTYHMLLPYFLAARKDLLWRGGGERLMHAPYGQRDLVVNIEWQLRGGAGELRNRAHLLDVLAVMDGVPELTGKADQDLWVLCAGWGITLPAQLELLDRSQPEDQRVLLAGRQVPYLAIVRIHAANYRRALPGR